MIKKDDKQIELFLFSETASVKQEGSKGLYPPADPCEDDGPTDENLDDKPCQRQSCDGYDCSFEQNCSISMGGEPGPTWCKHYGCPDTEECEWRESDGYWETCKDDFTITSGCPPLEMDMIFCCYCGRKIKEVRSGDIHE